MQERRKYPTWQWVAGILIIITMALIGTVSTIAAYAYIDTQKKIELKADKDDVEKMSTDMRDVRLMVESHIIETGAGKVIHRK